MRKTWLTGLILLACCSDEKSAPEERIADKLRDCDVIGEGGFSVAFEGEADKCELRCFEAAKCSELKAVFCFDADARDTGYAECLQSCGSGPDYACEDGSNGEAYRCDGTEDCADGSDEEDCADDALYECRDGGRVPFEYKCDGEDDCEDGSDEKGCPADSIHDCSDGDQIPKLWVCDAEEDCQDGSDEENCPAGTFFVCDDGTKVLKEWVCDGAFDCQDGEDEDQDCAPLMCGGSGADAR